MKRYAGPERRKADAPPYDGPERRRPGRPRLVANETTTVLHVRLPEGLHDRACLRAIVSGVSVSAVIRAGLEQLLRAKIPIACSTTTRQK